MDFNVTMFSKPEPDFFDSGESSFHYNHDPLFLAPPSSQLSPSFQRQIGGEERR
jgi:hypothetical protein